VDREVLSVGVYDDDVDDSGHDDNNDDGADDDNNYDDGDDGADDDDGDSDDDGTDDDNYRMEKVRTVRRALEKMHSWSESSVSTLAARVSLSPDSPTKRVRKMRWVDKFMMMIKTMVMIMTVKATMVRPTATKYSSYISSCNTSPRLMHNTHRPTLNPPRPVPYKHLAARAPTDSEVRVRRTRGARGQWARGT
jgi:hypothetical protein